MVIGHVKILFHTAVGVLQRPVAVFAGQKRIRLQPGTGGDAVQHIGGAEHVDVAGAGAALDGVDLADAEHGHLHRRVARQGQRILDILQQHHAVGRR